MKVVCHIISGFLRDDSRIFIRQCGSLNKAGYQVVILTNDGLPDDIVNNIRIISHCSISNSRIKDIILAKKYFINKALAINADIYQLHGPELIPLGLALKKKGKVVFYDAHEDLPRDILEKEAIPKFLRPVVSRIVELYLKINLRKFDEIFTVTPHFVLNLKRCSNNISLITNFPLIEDNICFTEEEFINRKNIICYAGTVYKYSNQEILIKAINKIQGVAYHVAGFIDHSHKKQLQNLDESNKTIFLGKLNKSELLDLFKSSIGGFVVYDYMRNLGYKTGSFGTNKIFEYMYAGLPIICTDFDLWKEIVDKYNCGICVSPNNPKQIENAINYLIDNKQKAFEMGQNGRLAVLKEYNWKTQEKLYLDIFKKYNVTSKL